MSALREIEAALARGLVDEDGEDVALELNPPAPGLATADLPGELRALLARTRAIEGPLDGIDFTGESMSFEMAELFPRGVPIAADGFGNFWVVDVLPGEHETAQVFYASHDPPTVTLQANSIAQFLHEVFRMYTPPHDSLVHDVHEGRLWSVAEGMDHAAALAAGGEIEGFARTLDERFTFFDLRAAEIGAGFEWAPHGPRTQVVRHGGARLFAVAPA